MSENRKYGKHDLRYSEQLKSCKVIVLANGPSLKGDLEEIEQRAKEEGSVLYAVNDFAMTELFSKLQPMFYCFVDHLYFNKDNKENKIFECLNEKVTWDLNLFIPLDKYRYVQERIKNNMIKIIPISTLQFEGFENKRYSLYKIGKAVPSFVNIVNVAIFTSLNLGCKQIFLYGVDHTFLKLIYVDDNNVLCLRDEHFYGSNVIHIRPKVDGSIWKVSDFVYDKYLTFKEHDNLRNYADYLGALIINCTKCSCIDSYIRLSQIKPKL